RRWGGTQSLNGALGAPSRALGCRTKITPLPWPSPLINGKGGHMTTPNPVQALLAAPRRLAAWALVGYTGLHLALVFLRWIVPADFGTFGTRSAAAAAGFTALLELAMPVLAVLLIGSGLGRDGTTSPPQTQAKLIATVALIE